MKKLALATCLFFAFFACKTSQKSSTSTGDDGQIDLIFLHINDVYEISPLENGAVGGLSRVAALRQKLKAENPNTFTFLAGDFISPSVTGSLKFEGKRIRGRHMIEVLNAVGLDAACFGNHEFDYDLADLEARLNESNFRWLATNIQKTSASKSPDSSFFRQNGRICPQSIRLEARDADGTAVSFALFSGCVTATAKPYVGYEPPIETAESWAKKGAAQTDFAIGLTHLFKEQDYELAGKIDGICPLIMGGHEHENSFKKIGKCVVAKADANAKTAYVHRLHFDKKSKKWDVKSELVRIDASLVEDAATAAVVKKWEEIAEKSFNSGGFEPKRLVKKLAEPLDCREAFIRQHSAPIGKMLGSAMLAAAKTKPDAAIFNAGMIRLDDFLRGDLLEYDVLRLLPFGGGISEVELPGLLLRKALTAGNANRGRGGFLQTQNIEYDAAASLFRVNGQPLEDAKKYNIVLPDFLIDAGDQGLEFLVAKNNAEVKILSRPDASDKSDLRTDVRLALIDFWSKN